MSQFTDAVLQKVSPERLQRAVEGLCSGAYAITLISHTDEEVSALVSNGDKARYEVVLTPTRAYCGCPDSTFRHTVCKHAVALALHALRNPLPAETRPAGALYTTGTPEAVPPGASPDLTLVKARPGRGFAA
jgi:uncharacterized Zn finger protein